MTTIRIFILSFIVLIGFASAAAAQTTPNFDPGRYILSNGDPMLGDNIYSAPSVCDWNGDGSKDLLVGVFYTGSVVLFLNQGTNSDPVFGSGTLVEADGAPINVGYG